MLYIQILLLTLGFQLNGDDYLTVVANQELVINAAKDSGIQPNQIEILQSPQLGQLAVSDKNNLVFKPKEDICDEVDRFTYLVHRSNQIDTITIFVEILCQPLLIYSGFSPNGDGENDTFTIKGIENFPNNSLSIYDYTGKEIYRKDHYANNWEGRIRNGESLSDAYTYYYVLDDGEGNYHSGYFRIDS